MSESILGRNLINVLSAQKLFGKNQFWLHMRGSIQERDPINAQSVGNASGRKLTLRHMREPIQEREAPLMFCLWEKFVAKCNRITYTRVHAGEKPCRRSICQKTYENKASLSIHATIQKDCTNV